MVQGKRHTVDAAHALHWQHMARAGLAAFYQNWKQCFWKRQAMVSAPSAQSCKENGLFA